MIIRENSHLEVRYSNMSSVNYDFWLTKNDVKSHLNLFDTDTEEDALLEDYIKAAVEHVGRIINRPVANHDKHYLFRSIPENGTYLFDGLGVTEADVTVSEIDELKDFYSDSTGSGLTRDTDYFYSHTIGKIKGVFIPKTSKEYLRVYAPIENLTTTLQPVLKPSIMSIVADMYRKREMTVNNGSLNKVLYDQLRQWELQ